MTLDEFKQLTDTRSVVISPPIMPAKKQPTSERFLLKVEFTQSCWNWKGSCFIDGYGQIKIKKKNRKTHRYSYELFIGPIPKGLLVCHSCDNPGCVRPSHLFLGTNLDNIKDREKKGRTCCGPSHQWTKYNVEKIRKVRSLHLEGHSYSMIAAATGVRKETVASIVTYRTWKNLDGNIGSKGRDL